MKHATKWKILSLNLILLVLLSMFAFTRNPGLLLAGNDGPTGYSLAEEQLTFFGITPNLHSNMLEGIGNISLPYNLSVQPGYWFGALVHSGTFSSALLYTWFALQLFICVLLMGWNYGFSSRLRYSAAWLLTLVAFPYFNSFKIYPITSSMPNFLSIVLVYAIMDIGIQRLGKKNWSTSIASAGIVLLGLIIGLTTCPVLMVLLAPMLGLSTVLAFVRNENRAELIRKSVLALALFILIVVMGWLEFLAGMMLNASGIFFKSEMNALSNTTSLIYSSILFHGTTQGMRLGPWLFCAATFGMLLAAWHNKKLRPLAFMTLSAQFFIVGGGVILSLYFPTLIASISTIYFEVMLLPFYALFTTYLVEFLIQSISYMPRLKLADSTLPVVVVLVVVGILATHSPRPINHSNYSIRPSNTAMTRILSAEIGIQPGRAFAGRVANIIPHEDWLTQMQYFSSINNLLGNDHQSTGLWLKHIPTLHEYSQTITPGFFRLYRDFLSDGTDEPYRSWSSFNKIDLKMLTLLGVHFIITTLPHVDGTTQRSDLVVSSSSPTLYLQEIKHANVAGISARQAVNTPNFHVAEDWMKAKSFAVTDAVVMNTDLSNIKLTSATISRIGIERGDVRLQAESNGTTLLILPLEFSHCLSVKSVSGDVPRVIRVDLALTGILFDRHVDIKMDDRTGPFANPRCRFKDYQEFKQLWKA